jgi:hypothetical protein
MKLTNQGALQNPMSLRTVSDYWRDGANEMSEMRQSLSVWGSPRPEIRQLADTMTISNGVVLQRPLVRKGVGIYHPLDLVEDGLTHCEKRITLVIWVRHRDHSE